MPSQIATSVQCNHFGKGRRWGLGLLSVLLSVSTLACESGGVGDPCIPEDEYRQEFSGYSKDEVNVESRSFQCETRVCLVNKFQGRVSCVYGQTIPDDAMTPAQAAAAATCKTPDDTLPILVSVPPQLEDRRPRDAVYCSCRCDGPQSPEEAPYCECPDGFSCVDLIDDIGLGNAQLAGAYCVKNGTNPQTSDEIRDIACRETPTQTCGSPDDFY